jgi:nucleoside-diphosphate-sugar epimerase
LAMRYHGVNDGGTLNVLEAARQALTTEQTG